MPDATSLPLLRWKHTDVIVFDRTKVGYDKMERLGKYIGKQYFCLLILEIQ